MLLQNSKWGSTARQLEAKLWSQKFGRKGKGLFILKLYSFWMLARFCLRTPLPLKHPKTIILPASARIGQFKEVPGIPFPIVKYCPLGNAGGCSMLIQAAWQVPGHSSPPSISCEPMCLMESPQHSQCCCCFLYGRDSGNIPKLCGLRGPLG